MDLAACLAELDNAFDAHDSFFGTDHGVGNIDAWDQDVLLSNAVLPDTNPLLEANNDVDDLHAILGEWESANMQVDSETFRAPDALSDFELEPAAPNPGPTDLPMATEVEYSDSPFSAALTTPDVLSPIASPEPTFSMKSLAGIVISSGPGGHFETYEVIEAPDAENLLEQFEASTSGDIFKAEENDVGQKSQIVQAVNSYFSGEGKGLPPGRIPKIVSSQRIRDSLPKEIIERIRESSQKSNTIAFIEPVAKSSASPSTCRFSDAAASLSRNRLLRSTSVSSLPASAPASSVASPVNLDHDYCTSNRQRRTRTPSATQPRPQSHLNVYVTSPPATPPTVRPSPTGPLSPNMGSVFRVSSACVGKSRELQVIRVEKRDVGRPVEDSVPVVQTVKFTPKERKTSRSTRETSNDAKKDSGLESGEASDDTASSHENDSLYTKLPSYLTAVPAVEAPGASAEREGDMHDRLPAYIKGVARLSTRSAASVSAASAVSGARVSLLAKNVILKPDSNRKSESTPSRCDIPKSAPPRRGLRKRQGSTSSSSSISSTTSSSSSRGRSARKRTNSRRERSASSSSSSRSRSPKSQRARGGNPGQPKHGDDRRVVYVGKIVEGTTRAELRRRFEVFGHIEEISLHFRDRGENYGFVKFTDRSSAFRAIERANDDPKQPKVDLCFGGRRNFCKEKYSDLDSSNSGSRRRTRSSSGAGASLDFDSLLKQAAKSVKKKT